jgi:hypothetical protein
MPRSRAASGPDRIDYTDGSVHEPVHDHHGKRLTLITERDMALRALAPTWQVSRDKPGSVRRP